MSSINTLWMGVLRRFNRSAHDRRIMQMAVDVDLHAPVPEGEPVVFFNASTRLSGMSLNAAFSLLCSWSLRLSGLPVVYYYCQRGLPLCVLGTNPRDVKTSPPCPECVKQSRVFYSGGEVKPFDLSINHDLEAAIDSLSVDQLMAFKYQAIPLGELVLPSVRWILRRYHLLNDESTRLIYRQYLRGAWSIYISFSTLLDEVNPGTVVVFNGMSYPEAVARWMARQRGIRVVTHEVCLKPFSAFFSSGDATLRSIQIPPNFELSPVQNEELDKYLEQRFKGNFKMAGVKFWSGMDQLDDSFLKKAERYKQIVPVFANVIFDTSQAHANVIFEHMFDWLDTVKEIITHHPETLFVLRAHPDEARPGKESRESVAEWVEKNGLLSYENVVFVDSKERISSYDLIRRSKFVMVYNSTIGLEASLMGAPVLCAGRSRFTDYPTVFFPADRTQFNQSAEAFLNVDRIEVPATFCENARRYLYYELYRASLPFDPFLDEDPYWQGYVTLKKFNWEELLPENSVAMKTFYEGIVLDKPFLIEE
ncbi:MAG: hypothetical protein LWX83_14100 [Anaerolineae bacterium]|nr:hypothetical protein [Anaerolineae bacterium]